VVRWLILAIWLPVAALAQSFPPRSDTHLIDVAKVLSAEDSADLRAALATLRAETGVEVVVVTLPRLAELAAGMQIESYATALFNAWGIGSADRDDGVLILVAIGDRTVRLELGAGYPEAFDAEARQVLDNAVLPGFREADYAGGLTTGLRSLRSRIIDPHRGGADAPPPATPAPFPWIPAALGALVFGGALALNGRRSIGDLMFRLRPCPQCSARSLRRTRAVAEPATLHASGRETVLETCTSCGHCRESERVLPRRRPKSRRSGSGGGGGRSSGGGATGRW
jgi:uncharacterized protein